METLQEIISDPFNKIKNSEHASNLVSCAQSVLQKRSLCAKPKFELVVDKLWKAATAGKARVLPSSQREKIWKSFHSLASDSEFIVAFEAYLSPALSTQPISKLFIQSLSRKFFEKIVLAMKKADAKYQSDESSSCKAIQMTNVDENILRYAAGYVPFALRKQCLKQAHNSERKQKAECLSALQVENEDEQLHSFYNYTKYWIEKQNRGGLFTLNDKSYLFFREVECHCRRHFNQLSLGSKSTDIRLPVLDSVFKDKHALEYWTNATADYSASVSVPVMQMCVKLWINIRGHAFASHWIEQFKQAQKAEQSTKKGLRKSLKNLSNLTMDQ